MITPRTSPLLGERDIKLSPIGLRSIPAARNIIWIVTTVPSIFLENRPKTNNSVPNIRTNVVSSLAIGLTCFLWKSTRCYVELPEGWYTTPLYLPFISCNSMHVSSG
ncbi:hypothetical protein MSMAS_2794 [Methanosarcina mazei S-6]|uniref:Uncharacterized protein n=2 Tax=Methanosarcina mazei TaxID=2209 RepID=A0A0E3RI14_METMZ|nr:hypothetical protein MSMAS_2794 [Methanosarcina mazei S-6]AKB68882.1 hypothetical protein MSMAL_2339 [Methanosarcina mazei LYC]